METGFKLVISKKFWQYFIALHINNISFKTGSGESRPGPVFPKPSSITNASCGKTFFYEALGTSAKAAGRLIPRSSAWPRHGTNNSAKPWTRHCETKEWLLRLRRNGLRILSFYGPVLIYTRKASALELSVWKISPRRFSKMLVGDDVGVFSLPVSQIV